MWLVTPLVLASLTVVEVSGLRSGSRSRGFAGGGGVPRGSDEASGRPGTPGSDEASGCPGTCGGPPGARTRPAAVPELLARTRPAAILGLAGGSSGLGRGQQPSRDVQVAWGLGRAPRRGRAARGKQGPGEAVAASPGCPGRLQCPEQGLGSTPGRTGRLPVGAWAWRSRVQPLLMRSLVPGDAGDGVPCSPSAQEGLLIRAGVSIPEDWPGSGGAPRTPSMWIYLRPMKALGLCPERTKEIGFSHIQRKPDQ